MLVYGKNVARETLLNNKKITKAIVCNNFSDKNLISLLQKRNICIEYVTKNEIDKLAKENNQGIILSIPDYEYVEVNELLDSNNPFIVILDHIEDPHNFGAIIRTCEALGVSGIIIPKDRSVSVNSTVMKTSAGALNNVKISMVTNLNRTIDYLKERNVWIIGTDMTDSVPYTDLDYNMPIALIIGNEGSGVSRIIKEK